MSRLMSSIHGKQLPRSSEGEKCNLLRMRLTPLKREAPAIKNLIRGRFGFQIGNS
jgi:hypothetical protein